MDIYGKLELSYSKGERNSLYLFSFCFFIINVTTQAECYHTNWQNSYIRRSDMWEKNFELTCQTSGIWFAGTVVYLSVCQTTKPTLRSTLKGEVGLLSFFQHCSKQLTIVSCFDSLPNILSLVYNTTINRFLRIAT